MDKENTTIWQTNKTTLDGDGWENTNCGYKLFMTGSFQAQKMNDIQSGYNLWTAQNFTQKLDITSWNGTDDGKLKPTNYTNLCLESGATIDFYTVNDSVFIDMEYP
jgi:hypothetical protein